MLLFPVFITEHLRSRAIGAQLVHDMCIKGKIYHDKIIYTYSSFFRGKVNAHGHELIYSTWKIHLSVVFCFQTTSHEKPKIKIGIPTWRVLNGLRNGCSERGGGYKDLLQIESEKTVEIPLLLQAEHSMLGVTCNKFVL